MRRRALHLEEITFEAGFWRDQSIHASQGAIEFSREGIIALYLLNGGGIGVIGVIATAGSVLKLDGGSAVSISIPFFVSLLAALLCNFFAYFTQIQLHAAFDADYWREYNSAHRLYFPEDQDLEQLDATIKELESKRKRPARNRV